MTLQVVRVTAVVQATARVRFYPEFYEDPITRELWTFSPSAVGRTARIALYPVVVVPAPQNGVLTLRSWGAAKTAAHLLRYTTSPQAVVDEISRDFGHMALRRRQVRAYRAWRGQQRPWWQRMRHRTVADRFPPLSETDRALERWAAWWAAGGDAWAVKAGL